MKNSWHRGIVALALILGGCGAPVPRGPLQGHLTADQVATSPAGDIPAPVQAALPAPKPRLQPKAETYSVVVNNVTVRDLLFALARDAKLNVDVHPGISGNVTLNAIDQTLPQLLSRIAKQVDMRFELDGPNLAVMPDTPFLRHYKVDYVNMARNVTGTVSTNTQIPTGTSVTGTSGASTGSSGGNISSTRIENASKNQFWESLEKNIKDILHETDKILPEGSSETVVEQTAAQSSTGAAALPQAGARAAQAIANALTGNPAPTSNSQSSGNAVIRRSTFREAASVIMNAEAGVLTVRATQRQHEKIQEFLDRVMNSARRQVMIEATIVEVQLGDGFEQGIDWTRLIGAGTFRLSAPGMSTAYAPIADPFSMTYKGNTVDTAIRLLQSFGTTKVLSSPRLSVLNNQTALLKVVENVVFFNVKADISAATTTSGALKAYTTTPQTVSVGLVLTVTPQVSDTDTVILNVRPTITSIGAMITDPNPELTTVQNLVPQIRTREIESIMRIGSGDIAVLGGLMEDSIDYKTGRVPGLGQIPVLGELVTTRSNSARKSELVIFLRPVVIKDASLAGDYAGLRPMMPDKDIFVPSAEATPFTAAPGR